MMRRRRQVAILYSSSQNSLWSCLQLLYWWGLVAILYSSSQNSLGSCSFFMNCRIMVAILYSSSQNSLLNVSPPFFHALVSRNPLFIKSEFSRGSKASLFWGGDRRNPLFIKSEFSREPITEGESLLWAVAILYSSSQNSLLISSLPTDDGRYKVAILYSSSQNSLPVTGEVVIFDHDPHVAILYSSSQNSLSTSAIPCPAWAKI